ncbi:polysaccharide lyase 6 family protein [Altererythrobacter aquiaggeris]|uniref:polysaccharide lyase 6 family protein n=1 Tax=Aestuarierythrobacter aquiaggeris TaxID=1898396 RepID=UPI0030159B6A
MTDFPAFGEDMLRVNAAGHKRFVQAPDFAAKSGGAEALHIPGITPSPGQSAAGLEPIRSERLPAKGARYLTARLVAGAMLVCGLSSPLTAENYLVHDQAEYVTAAGQVNAGDTITLASGEWRDFEMVISGKGEPDKPITVTSQTRGSVMLTGQSSLRIGGEYIVVSGLVFKNGYSPRGEVISFRQSAQDQASNSRVTDVVIDSFSKPDRYESDYWVAMYGRGNRFDHNHLAGKTNKGVTFAVRLDSEESRENGHRIDHNYFGPRPVLGSNGGETLRIGTSHYSMFNSNTLVENNVFDRADGEVEIISSKSGGNIFRGNVFLRSRGTLTLRHGDGNLVERNVFLGGGKDYTGGVRIINRDQKVSDNYMEGLRGDGFSSAVAVMNGVPNSPVNRYVEVENARISGNTVVDSTRITFGLGADEERSAIPSKTVFSGNLLSGTGAEEFIVADADASGITFGGNRVLAGRIDAALPQLGVAPGKLARAGNGLLYPVDPALANVGAPRDLTPVALDQVGVSWYPKPTADRPFGSSGMVTQVAPGSDTLVAAIAAAKSGDILTLSAGEYIVERTVALGKSLTLRGEDRENLPVIRFARPSLIELREGGNLQLAQLVIDGELAPDSVGNSVIRTTIYPIQSNMQIEFDGVTVRNLTVNKSFSVITLGKSTLADRIAIKNSNFADISGTIVSAAAETEDYGQYNVEYLDIIDSSFTNVGGPIADVYRGGSDESTFGPYVNISGNALADVGRASTNRSGAAINLHGVQTAKLSGNAFAGSAPLRIVHTVGTPKTSVTDNSFAETPEPILEELVFDGPARVTAARNIIDGAMAE